MADAGPLIVGDMLVEMEMLGVRVVDNDGELVLEGDEVSVVVRDTVPVSVAVRDSVPVREAVRDSVGEAVDDLVSLPDFDSVTEVVLVRLMVRERDGVLLWDRRVGVGVAEELRMPSPACPITRSTSADEEVTEAYERRRPAGAVANLWTIMARTRRRVRKMCEHEGDGKMEGKKERKKKGSGRGRRKTL